MAAAALGFRFFSNFPRSWLLSSAASLAWLGMAPSCCETVGRISAQSTHACEWSIRVIGTTRSWGAHSRTQITLVSRAFWLACWPCMGPAMGAMGSDECKYACLNAASCYHLLLKLEAAADSGNALPCLRGHPYHSKQSDSARIIQHSVNILNMSRSEKRTMHEEVRLKRSAAANAEGLYLV